MGVMATQRDKTYAFRRPAMRKGDMRGGGGVVVPRVATELVKAWSISRHWGRKTGKVSDGKRSGECYHTP